MSHDQEMMVSIDYVADFMIYLHLKNQEYVLLGTYILETFPIPTFPAT